MAVLVAAWVTFKVAPAKLRVERRWARKMDAYERVIDSLSQMTQVLNEDMTELATGRPPSKAEEASRLARYKQAASEISRGVDLGAYLFAKETQERLAKYQRELRRHDPNETWDEVVIHRANVTSECLHDIIVLAQEDGA